MKKKAEVFLRKEQIFKTVAITGSDKPQIAQMIIDKWQKIIDLIAKIIDVPSGLIMQITEDSMRVFLKSGNNGNPYEKGGCDKLGNGLYCETVIGTNAELLIDNALKYKEWNDNPDVKLKMISYYGLPIQWPDEEAFGTICVLDSKENAYTNNFKKLITEFKLSIEKDLELLFQEQELKNALKKIKVLSGLVPICSKCKKIRDDKGYWNHLETYIQNHSDVLFSHGICSDCTNEIYGKEDWYIDMKKDKDKNK